jgi:hypothetical protein
MPKMTSRNDRPIFVIGCPRSGTTLLQLMLHAHPRIAVPTETRFVLAAYDARRDFGDLREAQNRRALAEWIVGRKVTRFRDLGLDRAAVVEEIVAAPGTLGSALETVFRAYARRFGKQRWGTSGRDTSNTSTHFCAFGPMLSSSISSATGATASPPSKR